MVADRAALAAMAFAVLLLAGACGGDGDGGDGGDAGTPAAPQGTAAPTPLPGAGVRTVGAQEGLRLIAREGVVVIDVRTREEFAESHLEGARNLPLIEDYAAAVAPLDRTASYVLYCRTGNRSAQAAEIMREAGFTDVVDAGGLSGLEAAGAEVVRG